MKKIFSLQITLFIILNIFGVNTFAQTQNNNIEEIHISTVDEWNTLAKDCVLDTYSNNKKVILDNDISFLNEEFKPLPYFNGEFDGQNHYLKDIVIEAKTINYGVIRIACEKSYIHNINIEYELKASANRAGFIGYNQGKLSDICVSGKVDGDSVLGLIAGYNSANGKILNSTSKGEIVGKHYIGGVAGINYGRIENCQNQARVNTVVDSDKLNIETLTLETIIHSENVAAVTDVGGIAGSSYGVISSCKNNAEIGYEHVGYNIGGIAGTQSGYLENSYNYSDVKGRKEVGGIVGQQEPCLMIKYSEDYLQKMKRQINNLKNDLDEVSDVITSIGDVTYDYSLLISNNLSEAYRAIEIMLKEKPSISGDLDSGFNFDYSDDYKDARTALSSSMSKFFDSWNQMIKTNSSNVDDLGDSLNAVNEEVENLGNTAIDAIDFYTSERDLYVDISDKDEDSSLDGKIKKCINYGSSEGDLNVGGIVGSIAKENNLDPEDDFDIMGKTSSNFTYQMRAVVDACENYARINVKKNYAGGIVGNQTIGLIKNSINYGLLDCTDANYIGGVVGNSFGSIKDSYAKCFIWGNKYVGGVAGVVSKATNCGSLAQIKQANTNIGSLFGNYSKIETELVQETSDILKNWYVYDEYGAIDGISYFGKAYEISEAEMLELKIDENLKKVNVFFIHNGKELKKYSLNYGDSLDSSLVPLNVDHNNRYGYWEDFKEESLKDITKDLLFINGLNDIRPSISSSEDIAYIVAEGNFSYNDSITAFENSNGPANNLEGHTITYSYNLDESSNITKLRVYCFDYENFDVYININGQPQKITPKIDGRYAIIDFNENIEAISIVKIDNHNLLIKCGIGATVSAIVLCLIIRKKKKQF